MKKLPLARNERMFYYMSEDDMRNKVVVDGVAVLDEPPLDKKAMRFKKTA